ncbi:MAG: aminoglycoside phosphotransferase family protein [Candidatus Lokiarchaeota archaeon]|nr:aminoglycoside phosphotransferase family protein [Candidatus Harpocratesius repetitus]
MINYHQEDLQKIVEEFQIYDKIKKIEPLKIGHINKSYLVFTNKKKNAQYLLQQINHYVFPRPDLLQKNIHQVTSHIKRKIEEEKRNYSFKVVPQLVLTNSGSHWIQIPKLPKKEKKEEQWWRLYKFIPNTYSFEIPKNLTQVYHAGEVFGDFEQALYDFPHKNLFPVISHFHDLSFYWQQFQNCYSKDPFSRKLLATSEVEFFKKNYPKMHEIEKKLKSGQIPLRITHNDPKFNNILFDKRDSVVSIVDLDTVSAGFGFYDYGDALRSICNTATEDEQDLTLVDIDLERFYSFSEGFLNKTSNLWTATEWSILKYAPAYFSFMLGLRFLTDFLKNDVYFQISYNNQNLFRARVQFKLYTLFLQEASKFHDIIDKILEK